MLRTPKTRTGRPDPETFHVAGREPGSGWQPPVAHEARRRRRSPIDPKTTSKVPHPITKYPVEELARRDVERRLLRMFEGLKLGRVDDPSRYEPYIQFGHGDDAFLIEGDSLEIYHSLAYDLATSAHEDGFQAESLKSLLGATCGIAISKGHGPAVEYFLFTLERAQVEWTLIRKLRGYVRGRDLRIGSCEVFHELTEVETEWLPDEWQVGPWIRTRVLARDEASAQIIAVERFNEAEAILAARHAAWGLRAGEGAPGFAPTNAESASPGNSGLRACPAAYRIPTRPNVDGSGCHEICPHSRGPVDRCVGPGYGGAVRVVHQLVPLGHPG